VKGTGASFLTGNSERAVENQVAALRQIAERRGWQVVEQYSDAGISGSKGRDGRLGLDQMLKDAPRRKFDVIMAWAIDRLGWSLIDLLGTIQTLEACGVGLYLDQQSIDTTTPAGKLMFQVTGAFAEFERGMIRQRVNAGPEAGRGGRQNAWQASDQPSYRKTYPGSIARRQRHQHHRA
jgi:DNA invertase Pin-like site-specific DNA recombinase